MEFKEVNVPEGIIEQIDYEGPFAGITVDVGNVDISYPNVNLDSSYEETLDEINMERARYLLSTDEILEEKFGQTKA
ncbi:MAG: hypothetical protein PHH85_13260 [Candidatus Methanoperedens sp.]|nr:hypothetical protein [Candidatus Methanoperedens sp.]